MSLPAKTTSFRRWAELLVEALLERVRGAGAEVRLETAVTALTTDSGGRRVTGVELAVAEGPGAVFPGLAPGDRAEPQQHLAIKDPIPSAVIAGQALLQTVVVALIV